MQTPLNSYPPETKKFPSLIYLQETLPYYVIDGKDHYFQILAQESDFEIWPSDIETLLEKGTAHGLFVLERIRQLRRGPQSTGPVRLGDMDPSFEFVVPKTLLESMPANGYKGRGPSYTFPDVYYPYQKVESFWYIDDDNLPNRKQARFAWNIDRSGRGYCSMKCQRLIYQVIFPTRIVDQMIEQIRLPTN